jgi:hypothetical protein
MSDTEPPEPEVAAAPDADAIQALVKRLGRPHPSGGTVIERAAILAEGADFTAVLAWIADHDGKPENAIEAPGGGLHGSRVQDSPAASGGTPLRYVLPAGSV